MELVLYEENKGRIRDTWRFSHKENNLHAQDYSRQGRKVW